jgi:DNA-binding SARP family transcriptional activator
MDRVSVANEGAMVYKMVVPSIVTLFGSPAITRDGAVHVPDTRKAVAVLAYLAVEGPTVGRDRLAWLLWPESSQERARATLRRTLTSLRSAIGSNGLRATRESVTLEVSEVSVDAVEFLQAAEAGDHARVVDLYTGEFLAGFSLRDAPDFEDWQRLESDRFRVMADGALAAITRGLGDRGDPAAVGYALRRLELDPLNEEAYRSLMLMYARLGQRGDAVTTYRRLVRTLDEELAVTPLQGTVELYESIRSGEVPITFELDEAAPSLPTPARVELAGRDAELARFDGVLASGVGKALEIRGGPGSGKTALLEAMGRRAESWGWRVATARCFEAEKRLPYAPVAELLRSALATSDPDESVRADVARLLAEPQRPGDRLPASSDGPGSRVRLFESWAFAMESSGFARGVLLVDDIHRADEGTLEFLGYVANRIGSRAWVLVTTAEPGVRTGMTWRCEVLDLVYSPREWSGAPEYPLNLGTVDRQVLEAALVIDRPFDLDLIRQVVGRPEGEVVESLDRLVGSGLLRAGESDGDVIEVSGTELRDEVIAGLSVVRVRLLHQRAATALDGKRSRSGEAARHHELAGNRDRAAELYAVAAREAAATYAHAEALSHIGSALALGHEDRAGLHEMSGDLHALEGSYGHAFRSYETAAAISSGGDMARIEHKLAVLCLRRGDTDAADSHLASALLEMSHDDHGLHAHVLAARAFAAERAGRIEAAASFAAEAIAAAEMATDVGAEEAARGVAGIVALASADLAASEAFLRDSLRLADVARSSKAAAAAHNGLGLLLVEKDSPATATEHFEASIAILEQLGDRHRLAAALSNLADALHMLGRRRESNEAAKRSASLLADIGGDPLDSEAGIWGLTSW